VRLKVDVDALPEKLRNDLKKGDVDLFIGIYQPFVKVVTPEGSVVRFQG
jgi:hypothetical protein